MSVSGRIKAYQVVSRCPRYALIRPDTVPIHADTKSAPLSSVSDCKIQRDDSKKRDRVRISDVSTSVSGIVSAIMYLPVSVVCIVLYRTAYHTLYPRSCIALVSKHVSWVYQKDVSSHAYRTRITLRIARYAYQCLYLQRRDICVAACISDSIRGYRQCIGYMYRDVS